jgi:hypothetical protein
MHLPQAGRHAPEAPYISPIVYGNPASVPLQVSKVGADALSHGSRYCAVFRRPYTLVSEWPRKRTIFPKALAKVPLHYGGSIKPPGRCTTTSRPPAIVGVGAIPELDESQSYNTNCCSALPQEDTVLPHEKTAPPTGNNGVRCWHYVNPSIIPPVAHALPAVKHGMGKRDVSSASKGAWTRTSCRMEMDSPPNLGLHNDLPTLSCQRGVAQMRPWFLALSR